jgi:phage anti-repressor protein/very-short-patch-repair endonuclease
MDIKTALPILADSVNQDTVQTVNLRDIHAWLKVKSKYTTWVQRRIADYGFTENVDYISTSNRKKVAFFDNLHPASKEYHATLDTAIAIIGKERKNPKTPELLSYLTDKAGYLTVVREQERKEILFSKRLRTILKGLYTGEILTQYSISGYRIDFYLPKHNLAVEYDETHHKYQAGDDNCRIAQIQKESPDVIFIRVKEGLEDEGINKILLSLLVKNN